MAAHLMPGQTDGKVWVAAKRERTLLTEMQDGHTEGAIAMIFRGIKSRQLKSEESKRIRRMSSIGLWFRRLIRDE